MNSLSERSRKRLEGVHPFLIKVIESAIATAPYDFGIPAYGGLRTTKDQQELYAIGRTVDVGTRKPVTYVDGVRKKSNHQMKADGFGWAFDHYLYIDGRAVWNGEKMEVLARHLIKWAEVIAKENEEFKDCYLTWGGDWSKFKDYPHFEMKKL